MTPVPEAGLQDENSRLLWSLEHEADDLWKKHRWIALATLTIPVWLSGLILTAAWLWQGIALVRHLVVTTFAAAAAGRFTIWAGDPREGAPGFSAGELMLLVLYLDTVWAIVLTWHAGFLFHLPWLGPRLRAAVREGNDLLKRNRWMRRLTVGAVLLFVMLPISSTGSIGGSLLGRLLGLSQAATFGIVFLGSLLGGAVMLLGAGLLRPWFGEVSPLARYGAIAAIVLLTWILSRRYQATASE